MVATQLQLKRDVKLTSISFNKKLGLRFAYINYIECLEGTNFSPIRTPGEIMSYGVSCADPEIFMRGDPTKMVIFGHRRGGVQPLKNPEITFR